MTKWSLYISVVLTFLQLTLQANNPKLVVIVVVDGFGYHHLQNNSQYFNSGLQLFSQSGVSYENAYHPHGIPVTAAGHATLNTGTFPKNHGFVLNAWAGNDGEKYRCITDNSKNAREFDENGVLLNHGKSAQHLMVAGISDMVALNPNNSVFSLSYKSRAAIGMAGKTGKAIWYNDDENFFTSSKAYFNEFPSWLRKFNKQHKQKHTDSVQWKTRYHLQHPAYKSAYDVHKKLETQEFIKTPKANDLLFHLAKTCIQQHLHKTENKFLLWISVSSLDKIGHAYGPNSIYSIDTLLHLDYQIKDFMEYIYTLIPKEKTLVILTGDHGMAPIPEKTHKKGISLAHRIDLKKLIRKLNKAATQEFNIKDDVINFFKTTSFFLNKQAIKHLTHTKRKALLTLLKKIILSYKGIKKVLTYQELDQMTPDKYEHEYFYKKQLYPGRTGDLICIPHPYSLISHKKSGTAHRSPYEYDTHVPLIFYQPNILKPQTVTTKVYTTQVAVTIAHLLKTSKPPISTTEILPYLQ